MSVQKTKQNLSNLRVKAILASYIAIIGEDLNNEKDMIVFIPNRELFEKIALGEDFELDRKYIYEIISLKPIRYFTNRRMERIFSIIDSDENIPDEIPEKELNLIKEFIITKITLQQIEYYTFQNKQVRNIIQKERSISFIRFYLYQFGFIDIANVLNIKEKEDLDKLFKVLMKVYEILRDLNPNQPKNITKIVYRLWDILKSPENIKLESDPNILGSIKIPIELRELNKKKKELKDRIDIIDEKIEIRKGMETIPGELKNDSEIKDLKKEKENIENQLKEIESKIKELKEEWKRLISNKENT